MEEEFGLDGRLDHAKTKILSIFPIPPPPTVASKDLKIHPSLRKPASAADEDAPEKVKLVK